MNTTTASMTLPPHAPSSARTVLRLLQNLQVGQLDLQLPDGQLMHFGHDAPGERAQMSLRQWSVFDRVLRKGDIGLAESYMDGDWRSPDPAALLRLMIRNRNALEALVYGRWWGALLDRLRHLLNANTRRGSRRNIQAHYDLGNAFYRLWLDPSMNYSSAWFQGDHTQDLTLAQNAKMRRALEACQLQPEQRLLEIGCGWGAVAELAARDFGAQHVGVTLSKEQLAYAQERVTQAGVAARSDLRLQDYRDIPDEPFDAIVSIEMFEAVGQAYWPSYFRTLHDKLKPGGRACVQSIVIRDDLFDRYVRGTDFIQQYVFPGGLLPSPSKFREAAERAGLQVIDSFAFGPDYAETLRRWRSAFHAHEDAVRHQGYDTRFLRLWEFYLVYCEAAFDTGNCDVVQFTLTRPQ